MSRRVALGKLGTDSGTAKYGLRVSRPSNDAVPAASSSATVAIDQLRFDSLNHVIGHTPIYKIYDVTVSAASVISGTSNFAKIMFIYPPRETATATTDFVSDKAFVQFDMSSELLSIVRRSNKQAIESEGSGVVIGRLLE